MGILGLFFCLLDSTLAINWHTITTSYYSTLLLVLLYFWFTKNKKWIYNFALFNLLSLVYLFMMMNKAHLLIVASNYYEWYSLENRPQKQKKAPIII
jgi:hypothetical protein